MGNSRRFLLARSYALAFAVVLSPAFFQAGTCERGNTELTSLELEVSGHNLITGFDTSIRSYDVSTSGSTVTVRAQAVYGVNDVSWQWLVGTTTIGSGPIGTGGGELTIPVPIPDGQSVLRVAVKSNEVGATASGYYAIHIDRVPAYPCTEQGILDAIDDGGGPHHFDCQGPTVVTTSSEIVIDNDVILDGEGALTVDANDNGHRVFEVRVGVAAELRGLTITGGGSPGSAIGGPGVYNQGTLTLTDATVLGNHGGAGGGIYNSYGALTLRSTTVSQNTVLLGGSGGGVFSAGTSPSFTAIDSTISDNEAGGGGGISIASGVATVTNTTLSGNAAVDGGGMEVVGTASLTLTNSTLSGNLAYNQGGGSWAGGSATMSVVHSIVYGNAATEGSAAYGADTASATMQGSILEGTCAASGTPSLVSTGYNIESPGNTCNLVDPTDQVNVTPDALKVGPLGDHGGPTFTRVPAAGSVAIDQVPAGLCPSSDQRGVARPQGADCDVGAVEVGPADDAFACDEQGILDAIAAGGGPNTFDCVVPTTVTTTAAILINNDVILDGEGLLTVDGNNDHQVFSVLSDTTAELHGMTISGGNGGGVLSYGTLTLVDCQVSNNVAQHGGGVTGWNLTLVRAVVSGNTATNAGGGISGTPGPLTLIDSEVSNNTAGTSGGGIYSSGDVTLSNTTVSNNSALQGAGAWVYNGYGEGVFTSNDSVWSGNIAGDAGGAIYVVDDMTLSGGAVTGNEALTGGGVYVSGTLTLNNDVLVSENSAIGDGGAIYIWGTAISSDQAVFWQNHAGENGGAIYIYTGAVTMAQTSLTSNSAELDGGAIYADSQLMLLDSTLDQNTAQRSGGALFIAGTYVEAVRTTVLNNVAVDTGGGIHNSGNLVMSDTSVVADNTANSYGGGIFNTGLLDSTQLTVAGNEVTAAGFGGGIYNATGTVLLAESTISGNTSGGYGGGLSLQSVADAILTNTTVSGNTAGFEGGGIHVSSAGCELRLFNSTVANNTAGYGGTAIHAAGPAYYKNTVIEGNCFGGYRYSLGYNVETPGNTCLLDEQTDQPNVSAAALNLGPLQDNGGPTLTHFPLAGSVAIDQIPEVDCVDGTGAPLATDQRGAIRPWGTQCDIGSVEAGVPTMSVDLSSTTLIIEGGHVPLDVTIENPGGTLATVSTQAWIEQGAASRAGGGGDITCVIPYGDLPPGTCAFTRNVNARNSAGGTGTLMPGPATARFELELTESGSPEVVLHEARVPVTLVAGP